MVDMLSSTSMWASYWGIMGRERNGIWEGGQAARGWWSGAGISWGIGGEIGGKGASESGGEKTRDGREGWEQGDESGVLPLPPHSNMSDRSWAYIPSCLSLYFLALLNGSGHRWQDNLTSMFDTVRWSYGAGVVLRMGGIARLELNYCVPVRSQPGDRYVGWLCISDFDCPTITPPSPPTLTRLHL